MIVRKARTETMPAPGKNVYMSRYEDHIERQIRQAQERGEFENLPGAGKPLSGKGQPLHEDWWLQEYLTREQAGTEALPTNIRLNKEHGELASTLAREHSEQRVREIVADLNVRIDAARRGIADGPPLRVGPVDVEEAVAQWRESKKTAG